MQDIFAPTGSLGSGDPGGASTRRSKGCQKNFPAMGCSDGGCGSQEALRRL